MPIPLTRARWLAPALLLAACAGERAETRLVADQRRVDPPRLWRVDSLDPAGKVAATLLVCADSTLSNGFGRAHAEVNGRPCITLKGGVDRAGLHAHRCQIDGRRYGVTVTRTGDAARDFTAAFAFAALDGSPARARQVRRFRNTGEPCPPGWGIGDQARRGAPRSANALAATWGPSPVERGVAAH
ncbi:MAG: hypothetical protein JNK30_07485 [Phenylobacterium sp.]|uniref:hypothetical protein n=1 Tax=Phenylobacterium sp. TaxID=1871053 RepID=UPI001A607E47|nr:hypothetical protein [Phenylobacterium sp.]MBL8771210.1 hypothetical protein [Phenylobacterium sp.]